MSGPPGVVIPFHAARTGLWAAHREWMQTSGPLQQLASQMIEVLDGAERDLQAIEAALAPNGPHHCAVSYFSGTNFIDTEFMQ